ncbi:hypothetical protein [Paracidovorax avenae]|uniref:hypothetical protein n=1 Tax=Paracidovorax avenae TaxID=80867 RepID=UPI0006B38E8A|nr:hypothetical protein [Paracidovorax avenae]
MNITTRELVGEEAEALVMDQITQHSQGVRQSLSAFEAKSAVVAWLVALRGVEELINIPMFDFHDGEALQRLLAIRLDGLYLPQTSQISELASEELAKGVVERLEQTLFMASAAGRLYRARGWEGGDALRTLGGAIGFFQSRRRQMIALLYCMPSYCSGQQRVAKSAGLDQFLTIVEHSCVGLTGLYRHLILARIYDDYKLTVEQFSFHGNYALEMLNHAFLEPERLGITEVPHDRVAASILTRQLPLPKGQLFSAAELCNDLLTMEASYAEFDLGKTEFGAMARFIASCCHRTRDDYYIDLSAGELNTMMASCGLSETAQRLLIYDGAGFEDAVNSFAPFLAVGGTRMTTVTLLSRFAYSWKTTCLNKVKRFQIRSGFIFEDQVKKELTRQGFTITDLKRIERREFDVVATKNGVIYNIQCKNNLVDLARMEKNPKLFARYNIRLDKYYADALRKEEGREELLRRKLGLSTVKHAVLSKFPVATKNPRVLSFREIDQFSVRFVS